MDDLREALMHGQWGEADLADALRGMQLAELEDYTGQFWSSATAEALIFGNYSPDAVGQLSGMLDRLVSTTPAPALPPLRVTRIEPGESGLFPVEVEHDDAVLAWYLQGAGSSWEDRAATALTAQIMKSGFFDELRTEQQLGYLVSAFSWAQLDIPGLLMLIQSPVADTATLATAMNEFLVTVPDNLNQEQFLRHRKALVNDILQPDKNLWERAEFYWQSIAMKRFDFDGRQALADAVEAMTLEDWNAYFQRVFLDQPHSLQVAAPGRWEALPAGDQRRYESAEAIRSSHPSYVIE
jgi:insulysin